MRSSWLGIAVLFSCLARAWSIFCYKCESYRDFRCLDPFDRQPHVQVNCDYEPFVRDRKPVFCEKTTELVDGVYVTTRGCSTLQWEDIDGYVDHRNQELGCFRRVNIEQCLCTSYNPHSTACNGADGGHGVFRRGAGGLVLLLSAIVVVCSTLMTATP